MICLELGVKYLKVPKNPEITKISFKDGAGQFLLNPLKLRFVSGRRSKKRKLQKIKKFLKFKKLLVGAKKTENFQNPHYN